MGVDVKGIEQEWERESLHRGAVLYLKEGETIPQDFSGDVAVVLGHMDGLHRAHVLLLAKARACVGVSGRVVVMGFAPHAKNFFASNRTPFLLHTIDEKLAMLEKIGTDLYYEVRFDQRLAECLPEDFIHDYIVDRLAANFVVVGENFRFGKARKGSVKLLAQDKRFQTCAVEMLYDREVGAISSSKVREALTAGNVELASVLLGRPYTVSGEVKSGEGIAAKEGVATANLLWHPEKLQPRFGVYVVEVRLSGGETHLGIANFGLRPTFGNHTEPRLEAHLFHFDRSLYNQHIHVALLKFLRDEQKFATKEELFSQIAQDTMTAKAWLVAQNYMASA